MRGFVYYMSCMKKAKKAKKPAAKAQKKASKNPAKKAAAPAPAKSALGTPYGDRVLVKPQAAEEKTSFGLIIPDQAKEKPEQGVVVAVGPGKRGNDNELVPVGVKEGDRIMFSKYGYDEVKINGTEYYLIREDSITFVF
jgi:chaperonin GroES